MGSGSVTLLRPKIGYAHQKHDIMCMPRQQYTNTNHIPMESYHPVVSIMLRYMDQRKTFRENLCCSEVKIDNFFLFLGEGGLTYSTFLSNAIMIATISRLSEWSIFPLRKRTIPKYMWHILEILHPVVTLYVPDISWRGHKNIKNSKATHFWKVHVVLMTITMRNSVQSHKCETISDCRVFIPPACYRS